MGGVAQRAEGGVIRDAHTLFMNLHKGRNIPKMLHAQVQMPNTDVLSLTYPIELLFKLILRQAPA